MALPVSAALLVLSAGPAPAQPIPTTPIPQPASPGQAPISAPPQVQPLGQAVGEAGAGLAVLRLLPNSVPTSAIMPGMGEQLPKQAGMEAGMGLSSAQANSAAYLAHERAIAQASPFGAAANGNSPQAPGSLAQTALPDNPAPTTGVVNGPENPLLNVGLMQGSVHARWSETRGPCVDPIAEASTSIANLAALNAVPTVPDVPLRELRLPDGARLANGIQPAEGLRALAGLLDGGGQPKADGTNSVLHVPNTLSSRSVVTLVDIPGSKNKAVQSTSTLQASSIEILKGTPLELTVKVATQPTLRVTSTGKKQTSKVEYTAPVLTIERQGRLLYTLDAANPTKDIPIGLPLDGLSRQFGPLHSLPAVGGLVSTLGQGVQQVGDSTGRVLDVGVLRLGIAGLQERGTDLREPFTGYRLGASARMFDLQVLPTKALQDALPAGQAATLPSSLAQLSLGEQVAGAYAPAEGVVCGSTGVAAGGPQPAGVPTKLAQTSGAYSSVPLFWTGTAMLLSGVVLVSAVPGRRRKPAVPEHAPRTPSPRPRA
jgi:hypothetical protein